MIAGSQAVWVCSPWRWLALAALGAAACAALYARQPVALLQSYWIGLLTWTGVSVGALAMLALHGLVGGRWGELLGPALAAASRSLGLMAALFVPPLFQLPLLFPWATREQAVAAGYPEAQLRYLSVAGFEIRSGCYWGLWLLLAIFLPVRAGSRAGGGDSRSPARPSLRLSAAALPLLVLAVTFSSIDWMMSLEPPWNSTAYGVVVLAGQGAAALALSILVAARALADGPESVEARQTWNDAGNLLLAAVCFWMYVTFVQFQITWSGNLTEEIPWYLKRAHGPWRGVAVALVGLHFVVPFTLLLSRELKRSPRWLGLVAALVLAMHAVDVWWLLAPAFGHATLAAYGYDALAIATLGAAWMSIFSMWPPQWPAESLVAAAAGAERESQTSADSKSEEPSHEPRKVRPTA